MATRKQTFSSATMQVLIVSAIFACILSVCVEGAPAIVTEEALRSCRAVCCLEDPSLVGQATPFAPPLEVSTPQERPSVRKALSDPEYVQKYNQAYSLLRTSGLWQKQVDTHCAYSLLRSLGLNVHSNWNFLPWHRWFLYFHERTLQHLLNDTSFMLPFWDWDNAASRTILSPYRDTGSALFDELRNPSLESVQAQLNGAAAPGALISSVLDTADTLAFFGDQIVPGFRTPGRLENSAHNQIHGIIGQQESPFRDMGNLQFAPNDALFYVHHSNIDRLWALWKRLPPNANGFPRSEPASSDWGDSTYLFYDELGSLRSVKVSDSVDTTRLGYVYEDVVNEWLPSDIPIDSGTGKRNLLSQEDRPSKEPAAWTSFVAKEPREQRSRRSLKETSAAPPVAPTPTQTGPFQVGSSPTTVPVSQIPPEKRANFRPTRVSSRGGVVQEGRNNAEILILEGFQFYSNQRLVVHIFINNLNANLNTSQDSSEGFCGTIAHTPDATIPPGQRPSPLKIQIPLHFFLVRTSQEGRINLNLTLVSFTRNPETGASKEIPGPVASVDNMYILYR